MTDDYDAADDMRKSYDVAIATMRAELLDKRKRIGADHPLFRGGVHKDANGYRVLDSKSWGEDAGRREHRVVMERVLCRKLLSTEIVHHKNGDKADNRPENLEVHTRASHNREHGLGALIACAKCGKEKWYSPGVAARLSHEYQCRLCRYGRDWSTRK